MKELFWMQRNVEGLKEIGYLLTRDDILRECNLTNEEVEKYGLDLPFPDNIEGAYSASDTFSIRRIRDEFDLHNLLTWAHFDIYESAMASYDDTIVYPKFVHEGLKTNYIIHGFDAYTSKTYPISEVENTILQDYINIFGLTDDKLRYNPSKPDIVCAEISKMAQDNKLTFEAYKLFLKDNGIAWQFGYDDEVFSYDMPYETVIDTIAEWEARLKAVSRSTNPDDMRESEFINNTLRLIKLYAFENIGKEPTNHELGFFFETPPETADTLSNKEMFVSYFGQTLRHSTLTKNFLIKKGTELADEYALSKACNPYEDYVCEKKEKGYVPIVGVTYFWNGYKDNVLSGPISGEAYFKTALESVSDMNRASNILNKGIDSTSPSGIRSGLEL